MSSVASRLRNDLSSITERLVSLIGELRVERLDRFGDGIVIIAPDYYWGEPSPEQTNHQLTIKHDYDEWHEILRSVFRDPTSDVGRRIAEAHSGLIQWTELSSNWSVTPNPATNQNNLRLDASKYDDILAILEAGGPTNEILIPDTNALAGQPDPERYRSIPGSDEFVFMLLPTVLGELDDLKNNHRNPEFRDKVNKAITRIKGWRNQGNLREGVVVNKTITVKAVAREPDMNKTLSWLVSDNKDDRIIGSVLDVQAANPTSRVVLITGDINLSNKADLARVETAELV